MTKLVWGAMMVLQFKSNKLKKQCENPEIAQKDYGVGIGTKLIQRVNELKSATSLIDIKNLPAARLHKLYGDRSNEYAVDLAQPYRLVFSPVFKNGKDIKKLGSITMVRIEEVVDYHGE